MRPPADNIARYSLRVATRAAEPSPDQGGDKGPSGRLLLRMPRTLHAELAQLAEKRGVSLNQLIVGLLAASISPGDGSSAAQATSSPDARAQRRLSMALTVNLIVLVVVGVVAITLLVVALAGGF